VTRYPALAKQTQRLVLDILGLDVPAHLEGQTLPGVLIHHLTHFKGPPGEAWSWMRFHAQTWSLCSARRRAQLFTLGLTRRLFLAFVGTFSPSPPHSR